MNGGMVDGGVEDGGVEDGGVEGWVNVSEGKDERSHWVTEKVGKSPP